MLPYTRGEARQGMLSPRRGQGFGGLVPGRRRIGWEIDWDSCANAWTRQGGKAIRCLQALQARAFVQIAEDCGVMSLTSVTLPYAISALEGAGLDMNSPWSRGCHGRAHCQRVLLLTGRALRDDRVARRWRCQVGAALARRGHGQSAKNRTSSVSVAANGECPCTRLMCTREVGSV